MPRVKGQMIRVTFFEWKNIRFKSTDENGYRGTLWQLKRGWNSNAVQSVPKCVERAPNILAGGLLRHFQFSRYIYIRNRSPVPKRKNAYFSSWTTKLHILLIAISWKLKPRKHLFSTLIWLHYWLPLTVLRKLNCKQEGENRGIPFYWCTKSINFCFEAPSINNMHCNHHTQVV